MSFGVKSASAKPEFAQMVARDEMVGMGESYPLARFGGDVLAFHIKGATRDLNVAALSPYPEQAECFIAGDYRVVSVRHETIEAKTGLTEEERTSLREYAKREDLPIERFVSKKGVEMYKAGEYAYPAEMVDEPRIYTGKSKDILKDIGIVWVELEEIPMVNTCADTSSSLLQEKTKSAISSQRSWAELKNHVEAKQKSLNEVDGPVMPTPNLHTLR